MYKFTLLILFCILSTICFAQTIDSILKLNKVERIFNTYQIVQNITKKPQKDDISFKQELIQKLPKEEGLYIKLLERTAQLHKNGEFEKEIQLIESFIKEIEQYDNRFLIALSLHTKAVRNEEINNQNKALECFIYCYDELLKDPNKEFFKQSGILFKIASQYYKFKDYSNCVLVANNAEPLKNWYNPNNDWFEIVNANLIGMAYLKSNMYDSALNWLDTTFKRAKKHNYSNWCAIARGNIGNVYYLQKNYSTAISYFKGAIDSCIKYQIWDNVGTFCNNLADCYLRTDQIKEVSAVLNQSKNAIQKQPSNELWQKYYLVASSYYKMSQQNLLAFANEDSVLKFDKKLEIEFDLNKKVKLEANWAYAKTALQQELVLQKEKTTKWISISIMTFTIILLLLSIQYYKKQRLKQKTRENELLQENTKISTELEKARLELNIFKDSLRNKTELIEQTSKEIGILERQSLPISDSKIESLESLRKSSILTDKDWAEFQFTFRKAFPGFLASLKTQYKDLTPAEIRFLMFTKMDLSPKEMATTLGVGAEAIRNIRFRVRKKIDITGFDDLEAFTKSIS